MPLIDALLEARDSAPQVETRADTIYGFIGTFLTLALIAVCLRLCSRQRFAKIGPDDIAIVVGLVLYIGLIIATVFAVKYGLGLHIWDVPQDTAVSMQKCGFSSQVLYPTSLGAVKLSIILFLLRTLPSGHKFKKPLYCFAAFVVTEEAVFTIALFLQCRPIWYYWDKTTEGSCFNQPAFYYADAAVNMITDLCILSLPWFIFKDLNISKRRKYELIGICSVGVFTLISSAVRLPYLHDLNVSQDPTWHVVDICIWSIAELGSAITLSSVPSIRPLFAYAFPKAMDTGNRSTVQRSRTATSTTVSTHEKHGHSPDGSHASANSDPSWLSYNELRRAEEARRAGHHAGRESEEPILGNGGDRFARPLGGSKDGRVSHDAYVEASRGGH